MKWHANCLYLIGLENIENKFKTFTNNMRTIHSSYHLLLKFSTLKHFSYSNALPAE